MAPGSECAKRLQRIHTVAAEMAEELTTHHCRISDVVRTPDEPKYKVV